MDMGMPQLRPMCRRAQKANPNPARHNPTPSHCPAGPTWNGWLRPMAPRRPVGPCRCSTMTTSRPARTSRRSPKVARHGVLLAFLLNCASSSQQRMNAAQNQPTIAGAVACMLAGSVAEVVELQRQIELRAAQQLDGRLQVVALLARHPHLLALDAGLHLELRVLDQARDLPADLGVDPLLEQHLLAGRGEVDLGVLEVQAGEIHAALAEAQLQDLEHLLELK